MLNLGAVFAGLGFVAAVFWGVWNFEGLPHKDAAKQLHKDPREVHFQHDGVFGTFDRAQLQRGFQVYKEVCSACHSMRLVSYRNLADLGFTEAEVKAIAKGYEVPAIDDSGEAITRKALPSDRFISPFANHEAAAAANNGKAPPDLSLMVKARHDGQNYVYSLLTGYGQTPPKTVKAWKLNEKTGKVEQTQEKYEISPGLNYNPYFHSVTIAMAAPLNEGQVTYADGTKATVDQMAKDVTAFMAWTAEPKLEQHKRNGVGVLAFLSILVVLTFLSYKRIWAGVKH